MAVRYSHHAASTAGAVKRQVIVSLLMACRNMPEDTALTWDSVRAYAPSWEEVSKLCKQAPSKVEPASHDAVPEKGVGDSSASSSCSSESEDLQPVTLEWFQQRANGQMHLVQRSSQGRLVPWCRDFHLMRLILIGDSALAIWTRFARSVGHVHRWQCGKLQRVKKDCGLRALQHCAGPYANDAFDRWALQHCAGPTGVTLRRTL